MLSKATVQHQHKCCRGEGEGDSSRASDLRLPVSGSDTDWRDFRARLVAGSQANALTVDCVSFHILRLSSTLVVLLQTLHLLHSSLLRQPSVAILLMCTQNGIQYCCRTGARMRWTRKCLLRRAILTRGGGRTRCPDQNRAASWSRTHSCSSASSSTLIRYSVEL